MKRLFKRGHRKNKKKQQQRQVWKPEMVLLCYDHHENVKQIEINNDSGSEDSESDENLDDIENENLPADHKDTVQKGQPMAMDSVVRWTQKLSSQRIFEVVAARRWYIICAVLVVGIGVIIAWLCL